MPTTESVYGFRTETYQVDTKAKEESANVRSILAEHVHKQGGNHETPNWLKARLGITSLLDIKPESRADLPKLRRQLTGYVNESIWDTDAKRTLEEIFEKRWKRQLLTILIPEAILTVKTKLKGHLSTFVLADIGFAIDRGIQEGLETEAFMVQETVGISLARQEISTEIRAYCIRIIQGEYETLGAL